MGVIASAICKEGPLIVSPGETVTTAMIDNGSSCDNDSTPQITFSSQWHGSDKDVVIQVYCTGSGGAVYDYDYCSTPVKLASSVPSMSPSPSTSESAQPSQIPTSSAPSFPAGLIKTQNVKSSYTGLSCSISEAQIEAKILIFTNLLKATIVSTLRDKGMIMDPDNIVVTTNVISCSARNLKTRNTRSLQGSLIIEQEATFDAPTSTVDTVAIHAGISQGISDDSDLTGASVADVVLVAASPEERKPCDGITCGNAGKCALSESDPTQPTCICENTFELTFNSKGKPSCTCGSDTIFNADANRCFPPLTQAPTAVPSVSPTKTPTAFPTLSPTTKEEDPCVDDMISTFPLLKVDKEVGCNWLTKNKKKKRVRMNKYCGLDNVDSICPATCGLCS